MFKYAIVRTPPESMTSGITTANLGVPDHETALQQHDSYVEALRACGLTVITLPAAEESPDCCFVEDTALLTQRGAIVARLGAPARQGEEAAVLDLLPRYFDRIESIEAPGTIEPGDIMMVQDHFYIGLSKRTNAAGAQQMISLLQKHGFSGSTVAMREMLHLKSGLSYLENNTLLACGEFLGRPEFDDFDVIALEADEAVAANCIWVNGTVLAPAGFPNSRKKIEARGYPVISLDVSEFQKLDGGLSCLSLRF